MKKGLLFLMTLFCVMTGRAQQVVDNIASATEDFVFSRADSKVYAKNSSGSYEEYGLIPSQSQVATEIEYIETTADMGTSNVPYINTGYVHKANTRVVADVNITDNTLKGWEAVFGSRKGGGAGATNGLMFFSRAWTADKTMYKRIANETEGSAIPKGERILIDANGRTVTVKKPSSTSASVTVTVEEGTPTAGVNPLFIFDLSTGDGGRDNSACYMKLYAFKIYEGETLVMDLRPIKGSNGKGGLRDRLTGKTFFSSSSQDFAMSSDASSITYPATYNGKVYHDLSDGYLYKYTNGNWKRTSTSMAVSGTYQSMKNWSMPSNKTTCFSSMVDTLGYNIMPTYSGTAYQEPFHISVGVESGKKYNYSFRFSCGDWDTWRSEKDDANSYMRSVVVNTVTNDQNYDENGNTVPGDHGVLARSSLPHTATTVKLVSMDFTASQATTNLLFQFGFVADNTNYYFEFDNILIQKLDDYPSELYPDLEVAIKSIDWAKGKGIDTSIAENLLAQAMREGVGTPRDVVVAGLKQEVAEKSPRPTNFTAISESVVGTDDNIRGTVVTNHADGFYIYNVGTGRWFCGGDAWGAHAAVGFPGIKVTTPEDDYGSGHYNRIKTWLFNGDWDNGGVLDHDGFCDHSSNAWKFWKQDAEHGIYTWSKNGSNTGDNSGNGYGTKNLVGFASSTYARVNVDQSGADNPYNQWIFVTEAQRDAMAEAAMAAASTSNPVDLTYKIKMPGFNQRERKEGTNQSSEELDWTCNHANYRYSDTNNRHVIYGRNDNHADFVCDVCEAWNDEFSLTQTVTGLTPGKYRVKVQGYNYLGDAANKAYLYANGQKTTLVDRGSESVLPWTSGLPGSTFEAPEYFQAGLYWNEVLCTVGSNGELTLGVKSPSVTGTHVFIFDNFRLEYVGLVGATVGDADYTTFVAPYNISTIPDGVEAYACQVNTNYVHLEPVTAIPEGEAVVLKNTGTYSFSPASGSVELGTDNDLQASDGSVTGAAGNIYALAKLGGEVGFYLVNDDVTVPAGKGYLSIGGSIKAFYGFGEDDATGIGSIQNSKFKVQNDETIYNLAGQRMNKAQKGVSIVNGKKVLK